MFLLLLLPLAANATPVTWGFEGNLRYVRASTCPSSVGDHVTLLATWEADDPGFCYEGWICEYQGTAAITIGSVSAQTSGTLAFEHPSWGDQFVVSTLPFALDAGPSRYRMRVDLEDYDDAAFTSLAADQELVLSDYELAVLRVFDPSSDCYMEAAVSRIWRECADADADGVCDADDLCEGNDATGDTDSDGFCDADDVCPVDADADQGDADGDGLGDACETDRDGDGVIDDFDGCPDDADPDQADSDADGAGDVCDDDDDDDGVPDATDVCPLFPDGQADADHDGRGDACDDDDDADGVPDLTDACPGTPMDVRYDTTGCSGAQLVAAAADTCDPTNHGLCVSAIARAANRARDFGLLSATERAALVRAAAQGTGR